jgi:hypothetical protein
MQRGHTQPLMWPSGRFNGVPYKPQPHKQSAFIFKFESIIFFVFLLSRGDAQKVSTHQTFRSCRSHG